ncbi:MAG TPA: VWA domain-containing protein [Bacteroidota bacterium]|nr:VWA domain-containing protein [Bacteroidota bacterium]
MLGDRFANPEFLWLLAGVPLLAYYFWWKRRTMVAELQFSSLQPFGKTSKSIRERLRHSPVAIRLVALACLIVALARPQSVSSRQNTSTEGIDIVLLLDISGSMLAEDFVPNRISAAKQVAEDFIDGRQNDRIGLVIFSGESFTQCPLTTDYTVLKNLLHQVKQGMIVDGTAIGMAIANGVNRLKDSQAKSKVMILLTDGMNNRGEIDPITATKIAATYGVRIYTVGVGAQGEAPYPVPTPFGIRRQLIPADLDEKSLKAIADMTGGRFFRATDNDKLKAIYKEIDKLERSKIEITAYKRYTELYPPWLMMGLAFVVLEVGLSSTVLRKVP